MELYFLRHGNAVPRHEWKGDDKDRPLTDDGRRRLTLEGEVLAHLGLAPDVILSSTYARALQTAQIISGCLKGSGKIIPDKRLDPGFGCKELEKILREHAPAGSILLIGLEPELTRIVGDLIGRSRVALKRGGLAHVELSDPKRLRGRLVALIPPLTLPDMPLLGGTAVPAEDGHPAP